MIRLNIGCLVKIIPSGFIENFESNWFVNNNFMQLFVDSFEIGWFVNNNFSLLFQENFEGVW